MKFRLYILIFLILIMQSASFGQLVNNGGTIMVQSGADLYITGGGNSFTNQSNGANYGNVHNYGNIFLDGHWVNETQTFNSTNASFNAGSGTVSFIGNSNCNLNTGNYAFYNLVINNPSGLTITTNNCRIDKTLTLTNGMITTGANILTVENWETSAVSGFNDLKYINGCLTRRVTTGYASEEFVALNYSTSNTTTNSEKGSIINVTSTTNDPMIHMETVLVGAPYDPAQYRYVEVRYRVIAGTAGNMELFWCTLANQFARGGFSTSNPLVSDGLWHNLVIDLFAVYTLTSDNGQDIVGFRYDWCTASGVTMDIDYIKVTGNPADEYDFPIGTSAQYENAKIKINTSSGITHINSKFIAFNPPTIPYGNIQSGLSVSGTAVTTLLDYGYWDIYPNSGGTASSYDETLTSRGHTNGGTDAAQHTVVKRADAATDWSCFGTHNNGTQSGTGTNPITAKRTVVNGFSHHAIARSELAPLPVELISFKAFCELDNILLKWITLSEINNDYFEIEKSRDAVSWHTLTRINSEGNSNEIKHYQVSDNVSSEIFYYRLKQTDMDGTIALSEIVTPDCKTLSSLCGFEIISASLDGENNEAIIILQFDCEEEVTVDLFDCVGRKIAENTIHVFPGSKKYKHKLNYLPRGMYLFVVRGKEQTVTRKLIY